MLSDILLDNTFEVWDDPGDQGADHLPKVSKGPKRFCPYCNKERSVKLFTKSPEICNFCFYFDKAAALTAPKEAVQQ